MDKLQLAFYRGPSTKRTEQWVHRLICFFTGGGSYSHVELLIDGYAYTSSERDGGIRVKRILMNPDKWTLVDVRTDKDMARDWFLSRLGQKYDYAGALRFVLPFLPQRSNQWFCSEAVAAALGLGLPEQCSPNTLARMFGAPL